MDFDFLKTIISDQYEVTDDNIVGVGWGYKYINDEATEIKCLSYMVKEKKPISELTEDQLIPKTITISGVTFTTDVIISNVVPTQFVDPTGIACNPNINPTIVPTQVFGGWFYNSPRTMTYCDQYTLNWDPGLGAPYSQPITRQTYRPLKNGVSTINVTKNAGYVCTMGLIAVDNDTDSLVGLSNNHCYVEDAFIASQRNPATIRKNELNSVTIQSADASYSPSLNIGVVKKYVPLTTTAYNKVDGALTTLKQADININESWKHPGLNITAPMQFATTSEINSLMSLSPSVNLYSAGRTTGPKGEASFGGCRLKIDAFPVISQVPYNRQGVDTIAVFDDQIKFKLVCPNYPNVPYCPFPIQGGDSGSSLLVDLPSGERKVLGLIFACSQRINCDIWAVDQNNNTIYAQTPNGPSKIFRADCEWGLANRIDHVANELNIRAWLGESNINYSDPTLTETICSPNASSKNIVVNGKTYWQLGFCPPLTP